MKKVAIVLIILLASKVQAQDKFSLGIKVGQNFTSVDNVFVDHNSASYHIGATAQIGIGPLFSIVPEVILSQTKLEANLTVLDLLGNQSVQPQTFHMNYLAIPLLAQYKPFKSFIVQAGPQYSIFLDQKKDGIGNASMAFNSGEFALVGGAKIDLGGFFIYGRYIIGMNTIGSAAEGYSNLKDQSTWKTRQWQLGVGLNLFNF